MTDARRGAFQEAFRISLAITLALFVWKATHLPHGYWLLLTISVLYIGVNQGHVLQRAGHRILGTTLGIVLAFFFVNDLMYQNYHWGYLFPFFYVLMFYLYSVTGNYIIFVTILTCFIGIYLAVLTGSGGEFFLFGTLFNRFLCTLLGVGFVLVMEGVVFPGASRASNQLERTLSSLFQDLEKLLQIITNRYTQGTELSIDEWSTVTRAVEKHASARDLQRLMHYELNLDRRYERFSEQHVEQIPRLLSSLRRLTCLIMHPEPGAAPEEDGETVREAGRILARGFRRMERLNRERLPGEKNASLSAEVSALFPGKPRTPTFLQEELEHCAAIMDEMFARLHRGDAWA
jgi:uncharacterized membrane protein YccC